MKINTLLASTFTLAFLFATLSTFGQTTLEEYNYITKGYKIQVESGLDMKKGYEFEEIETKTTNNRIATLKVLYRVRDTKKTIAAYLITYKRTDYSSSTYEYICIPSPTSDSEIMNYYWKELYDGQECSQRLQIITYFLSKQLWW